MPVVFRTTRLVEFGETDMAGIVHFANFFRYMEAAEHAFLRSRGLSVAMEWEGQAIGFPRVSASCDYLRPVRFEDVLGITVEVVRVGRKSVSYAVEFHLGRQLVARGGLTAVCCRVRRDPHGIESIDIPEGVRAKLLEETPDPGRA
jgi:YbgC/YbaW family acyl-CoA thioester hydrolase